MSPVVESILMTAVRVFFAGIIGLQVAVDFRKFRWHSGCTRCSLIRWF
jgi:hypothetical protein